MSNFIHISKIVEITYKLTDARRYNGTVKIHATELATSVIQERQKRFYFTSANMVVDILSYFDETTNYNYDIFVEDIKYTQWLKVFEDGELETISIKIVKKQHD